MRFAIAVGIAQGCFVGYVADIPDLRKRLTEEMQQGSQVVEDVAKWAEDAKPGEWLDAPTFWVFCIGAAPTRLRYPEATVESDDLAKTRILH